MTSKFETVNSNITTDQIIIPYPNGFYNGNSDIIGIICHTIYGSWVNSDYEDGQYGVNIIKSNDGIAVSAKTTSTNQVQMTLMRTDL